MPQLSASRLICELLCRKLAVATDPTAATALSSAEPPYKVLVGLQPPPLLSAEVDDVEEEVV